MAKPIPGVPDVWRGLERDDLFPVNPWTGLRAFLGRARHFVPDRGLRSLLEQHMRFPALENAPIPLRVIAADALTGDEVVLDRGPVIESVLASAAIPAVYPPVELGGRLLIDGGVVNNTPITVAVEAGASEVWVLSTGYSCGLAEPPDSAFAMAMHAVALLVQQRLLLETSGRDYPVPVRLIPPPCPITVTPIDFSQTAELIDLAAAGTRQWLDNGMADALPMLALHQH